MIMVTVMMMNYCHMAVISASGVHHRKLLKRYQLGLNLFRVLVLTHLMKMSRGHNHYTVTSQRSGWVICIF